MTTTDYLSRELRRARLSLHRAEKKPNTPESEMKGLRDKIACLEEALSLWNTRPAPPIGLCKDCEHYTLLGHCKIHSQEPDEYGPGAYVEMLPDDFCSYFSPKGGEENAAD